MRVIISGGGTGGHVFPAISIAEEIINRSPQNEVLFVGTKKGIENKLVSERGYNIKHINSGGIIGKGLLKRAQGMASAAKGVFESGSVIKSFKPDFVLGTGGYVSGPVVLSASISGIATAICEQNSVPGVTNRILGKFVKRIFTTYKDSEKYFSEAKTILTGNPIRKGILNAGPDSKDQESEIFTCLVFGGSQGARRLNTSVPEALSILGVENLRVIHQTGEYNIKEVSEFYDKHNIDAQVLSFIDDMAGAYAKSDFVIGRSGAGTIAEITALGKPSMLIPFPFATHNHQYENAKSLQAQGAAILVSDEEATPEKLAAELNVLKDNSRLKEMGERARKFGKPEAASHIVDEIYKLTGVN